MTLAKSIVAFFGKRATLSFCAVETNGKSYFTNQAQYESHHTMWLSLLGSFGNTDLTATEAGANKPLEQRILILWTIHCKKALLVL